MIRGNKRIDTIYKENAMKLLLHSRETSSIFGKLKLVLTYVVLLGITLNFWGITLNAVVVMANNNIMPVISEHEDVIVGNVGTERQFITDGKLMFLSDRHRIVFPEIEDVIPTKGIGKPIRWWAKQLDYPIEGGISIVSVGDLMRWSGTILFLSLISLLILSIPNHAAMNIRVTGNWRGQQ